MIRIMIITLLWVGALYALQFPVLKKANRVTRWMAAGLMLISAALWVYLRTTIEIPRPAEWLNKALAPFTPVP